MADLSTDSTGPAPILATDPDVISGAPSDQRFSERVKKFFDSFSPAGSTAYETAWQPITPASGFTASANLGVRRRGKSLDFRGQLTGTVTAGTTITIGTVPSGFIPPSGDPVPVVSGSGFVGWATVNASTGVIQAHFKTPFTTSSIGIGLAGLSALPAA